MAAVKKYVKTIRNPVAVAGRESFNKLTIEIKLGVP